MITLRSITPDDKLFLCRLYASTREDELSVVPWSDAEKESFLTMQFNAQHTYYQEQFKQAEFLVVELDGEPIGRLYIDRRQDEIRLIDIALLTSHRRKGIGSMLLKDLLTEGSAANLPVRIHVEHNNPALSLYTQLGFKHIEDQGVYFLMEWSPINNKNLKSKELENA
ncbi:MAG: N-acetyltransferase [Chloroflexi bacterium]|nr:MAG: N-acetyltransferase [Chloroflexota bacterium]